MKERNENKTDTNDFVNTNHIEKNFLNDDDYVDKEVEDDDEEEEEDEE
jgi:hypothetical protein